MSTHNIHFCGEKRKLLCGYPLLSGAMITDGQNDLNECICHVGFFDLLLCKIPQYFWKFVLFSVFQVILVIVYISGSKYWL